MDLAPYLWGGYGHAAGTAFQLKLSQLVLSQPMLNLPWNQVLEHEAGVGVNTKLVDVARAGVVHT